MSNEWCSRYFIFKDMDFDFWKGDRVQLRAMKESDALLRNEETRDSNGFRLMNWGVEAPKSLEMDKADVAEWIDYKDFEKGIMFAIDNLEGEHVGAIYLNSIDMKNGTFSFGIRIYRPFRNNGYAQEAIRIVLRYAFFEQRLQKCNSGCIEGNLASQKMHENVGFVVEGSVRRSIYMNGHYYNDLKLGLTVEEFVENEKAYSGSK
ncbi:Protein N-acetyltransferase, RimJ/RimL family [Alkalibacterium putridalgicola]|uniref:Aminoglycoside N(6')-acetyltransferase n=1 Tax=Alkalibacterium putridalgicola TaxID=426703 RepID=A0A1H7WGV5_9LACT|nr:GNAT family protein [Alkalibacterium putridalgicola]GEK90021.1 aminoglycoside N(6')-acetyltransferase [Alkalibacterium putridalgicola]SEM20806.1 Protein N-acetyltransferase, RimJ/RimL family [Alkalibacterium putridalgicola]